MPIDVPLRCTCGALTGVARGVSATSGVRLVCHCDDCQSFAHWLGRPSDILDEFGGTDVFQISPAQVTFHNGTEHLALMRLSPRGLPRWYASCCNTPVCNTMASPRAAFASLIQPIMQHEGERNAEIGPIRGRVNAAYAQGSPPDADARIRPGTLLRSLGRLAWASLRGEHSPSPFFEGGEPSRPATVISLEERERLRAAVRPQVD